MGTLEERYALFIALARHLVHRQHSYYASPGMPHTKDCIPCLAVETLLIAEEPIILCPEAS